MKMLRSSLCLFLLAYSRAEYRPAYATHVFKETMPQLSSRTDLQRRARVKSEYVHEVVFAVKQNNMDELIRVLHDVSNPVSPNYGQHWSDDQVATLTSNPTSRSALVSYLHTVGASIRTESLHGDFITATAPVSIWESMFNTEFYTFHHTRRDNEVRKIVSAERYSIPVELDEHVDGVFYVIDVPIESTRGKLKLTPIPEGSGMSDLGTSVNKLGTFGNEFTQYGVITPYSLRAYYNMSGDTSGSSASTQGIFSAAGQYYSPSDILAFQTLIGLPQQLPTNIGNHSSDAQCVANSDNCGESNLDLQYIMSVSPVSPTTNWYTDSDFNAFLISISSLVNPPMVFSISYGAPEAAYSSDFKSAFSILAIKLGVRGVSILASSGDSGAVPNSVAFGGDLTKCAYEPDYPASNPYVTAVGATSVSHSVHIEQIYVIEAVPLTAI